MNLNLKETNEVVQEDFNNGKIGRDGRMGLSIVIAGGVFSGRTTVASIIENALEEAGFKGVVVHDEETSKLNRTAIAEMFPNEHPETVKKLLEMDIVVRMAVVSHVKKVPNVGDLLIESAKEAKLISEGKLEPAKAFSKQEKKFFVQIGTGGHKVIEDANGRALEVVEPKEKNTLNAITPWLIIPSDQSLSEEEALIYNQPFLVLKDGKEYTAYYGKRVTPTPNGELIVKITGMELVNIRTAGLAKTNMLPTQISEIAFVEETSEDGKEDTPFGTANVFVPVLTGAGSNTVTEMVFYGLI